MPLSQVLKYKIRNLQSEIRNLCPIFHQSFRMGEKQGYHISALYATQSTGEKGGLTERLATVHPGSFCRDADGDRVPGVAGEAARR